MLRIEADNRVVSYVDTQISKSRRNALPAEEAFMRTIVLVAAALAALPLTSIRAHADGAWCARDTRGGTNCGFHTYAQCQADIRGIGGSCDPNPAFKTYNHRYQAYSRDSRRRSRDWQY